MTWPIRLRVVAAVAVFVLLAGASSIARLAPSSPTTAPTAQPASTADSRPETTVALVPDAVAPSVPVPPVATPGAAASLAVREVVSVAEAVVRAWQETDTAVRAQALGPLVTPEYLALASTIDPSRVPQAPIARSGLRTEADGQALVDVELDDGTAVAVLLVTSATGAWLGSDVLPVEAGAG